jgi:alanine-synthesizing transaminase
VRGIGYGPSVLPSRRSRVEGGPNRLWAAIRDRRVAGKTHLDLTVSNPTSAGIPYDAQGIRAALGDEAALVYEPAPFGLEPAREAVAGLWRERGIPVEPARIALTGSTSEAYSFLFKLLCDPGESVLVPCPSYPLFEHLARYEGVEPVPYPLSYDGSWHVDLDALRRAVTDRTRAIVVVNPNNPTGSFLKRDELRALGELGLPIISDEVFGEYGFEDAAFKDDASEDDAFKDAAFKNVKDDASKDVRRRASSALLLGRDGPLVFALDGLSKLAALPQMKLAWITASGPDADIARAFESLELVLDTFLSPNAPVQHALPRLLCSGRTSRDAIRARARANKNILADLTRRSAVTPLTVEGGWSAPLRLPATRDDEEWTLGLLEDRETLVQPGFFYDFPDGPSVVLSLLTRERDFEEGVSRLVDYVDAMG